MALESPLRPRCCLPYSVRSIWPTLLLLLSVQLTTAAVRVALRGKLVVLNEPRRGQQPVGPLSYHVRLYVTSGQASLYTLVFAPGLAKEAEGAYLKTGDIVYLTVDLERSGPVPSSLVPVPTPTPAATGTPGTLFVVEWWAVGDGFGAEGPSRVYPSGGVYGVLPMKTVLWRVTSVCEEHIATTTSSSDDNGMFTASQEEVEQVLFGPAPGTALLRRTAMSSSSSSSSSQSVIAVNNNGSSGGVVRGSGLATAPTALNRWWDTCSFGTVRMKRSDVLVLNVSLPCSGMRDSGAEWAVVSGDGGGSCGWNELWGMMEHAVAYTQQVLRIDLTTYPRRVLLLPSGPSNTTTTSSASSDTTGSPLLASGGLCPGWQQRGSFGCDEMLGCDMWIKADPSRLHSRLLTQLGSSLTLQPALRANPPPSLPPLDPFCPMGAPSAAGEYKCFNGPAAFKLFFAHQTTSRLDASNMFAAIPTSVTLPAAATSPDNLLLVYPNWPAPAAASPPAPSTPPMLFCQYRASLGAADAGLSRLTGPFGRITVHVVPLTAPAGGQVPVVAKTGPPPTLLAMLGPGESYRYDSAGIMFRFASLSSPPPEDAGGVSGGTARLEVCRYQQIRESDGGGCYDGQDNDCDGLVDGNDPDCAQQQL